MWLVLYRQDSGAFVATVRAGSPFDPTLGRVPYETEPDLEANEWDPVQRMLVPRPPAPRTWISVLEFTTQRFTQVERERIELATELHPDPLTRARLRTLDKDLRAVTRNEVNLVDPRTIGGVQWLTTVSFDGAPLLEPHRPAEILALP